MRQYGDIKTAITAIDNMVMDVETSPSYMILDSNMEESGSLADVGIETSVARDLIYYISAETDILGFCGAVRQGASLNVFSFGSQLTE